MLVVEMKGRYIDRRAALSCRRVRADKQHGKGEGVFNVLTGALMAFVPALFGATVLPALFIYIGSIYFLAAGAKKLMRDHQGNSLSRKEG